MTSIPSEQAALAALESVPGITWRPFERADLPAIAELYATCEAFDANSERQSLSGLEEFWDSPRSRPDEDTRVAHDDRGEVVATAWAGCNRVVTERRGVHLGGAVRPDHRGRGIGGAVLRWELAHGLDWDAATRRAGYGPLVVRLHVPTDQHDVRDLAERHGLAVERYYTGMSRSVADPPVVPTLDGIRVVGWDPARSPEVHRVVDRAFRDHWGHADRTDEMWEELTGSQDFRPDWTVLAVDDAGDEVVGAALNCAYEQDWEATGVTEGYTDQLGVARVTGAGESVALCWPSPSHGSPPPACSGRHWTSTPRTPPARYGCTSCWGTSRRRARASTSSCVRVRTARSPGAPRLAVVGEQRVEAAPDRSWMLLVVVYLVGIYLVCYLAYAALLAVFSSEGSVPPSWRDPEIPAGAELVSVEETCASGGCWREITLRATGGRSVRELAAEMDLTEPQRHGWRPYDPASVSVQADRPPRTRGLLRISVSYDHVM